VASADPDLRLLEAVLVQIRDELRAHGQKLDGLKAGQDEVHDELRGLRNDLREVAADAAVVKSQVAMQDRRLRKLEGK
jgi:septation ring formation regulator EzrA